MLLEALEILQNSGGDTEALVTDLGIYKVVQILTVYLPLATATFLLSQEFIGEKIACFPPSNFTDHHTDPLQEYCWNEGRWISSELARERTGIYTQPHRYYPLYLPLQAIFFLTPIIIWNILTKSKLLAALKGTEEFLDDLLEAVTKGTGPEVKEKSIVLIKQFHTTCVSTARTLNLAAIGCWRLGYETILLLGAVFMQFKLYNRNPKTYHCWIPELTGEEISCTVPILDMLDNLWKLNVGALLGSTIITSYMSYKMYVMHVDEFQPLFYNNLPYGDEDEFNEEITWQSPWIKHSYRLLIKIFIENNQIMTRAVVLQALQPDERKRGWKLRLQAKKAKLRRHQRRLYSPSLSPRMRSPGSLTPLTPQSESQIVWPKEYEKSDKTKKSGRVEKKSESSNDTVQQVKPKLDSTSSKSKTDKASEGLHLLDYGSNSATEKAEASRLNDESGKERQNNEKPEPITGETQILPETQNDQSIDGKDTQKTNTEGEKVHQVDSETTEDSNGSFVKVGEAEIRDELEKDFDDNNSENQSIENQAGETERQKQDNQNLCSDDPNDPKNQEDMTELDQEPVSASTDQKDSSQEALDETENNSSYPQLQEVEKVGKDDDDPPAECVDDIEKDDSILVEQELEEKELEGSVAAAPPGVNDRNYNLNLDVSESQLSDLVHDEAAEPQIQEQDRQYQEYLYEEGKQEQASIANVTVNEEWEQHIQTDNEPITPFDEPASPTFVSSFKISLQVDSETRETTIAELTPNKVVSQLQMQIGDANQSSPLQELHFTFDGQQGLMSDSTMDASTDSSELLAEYEQIPEDNGNGDINDKDDSTF